MINTPARMAAALGFQRPTMVLEPLISIPPGIGLYPLGLDLVPVTTGTAIFFLDIISRLRTTLGGKCLVVTEIGGDVHLSTEIERNAKMRSSRIDGDAS